MNIVFFGSDSFGIPALEKLIKRDNLLIVTEHDKPMGRGRKLTPLPIKSFALENNLPFIETENCNDSNIIKRLKEFKADFIVVASFGQILNEDLLRLPRYMPLNIHPSILPKYRGAAPIRRAIMNCESKTGVTIIKIAKKLDAGEILDQVRIPLTDDDVYTDLFRKLSQLGAELLIKSIDLVKSGQFSLKKQNDADATYATKIKNNDYILKVNRSAQCVLRQINAFSTKPGAIVRINKKPFKIINAALSPNINVNAGALYAINKHLYLGTNSSALEIIKIQPAGKSVMSGKDFINGYRLKTELKLDEV